MLVDSKPSTSTKEKKDLAELLTVRFAQVFTPLTRPSPHALIEHFSVALGN